MALGSGDGFSGRNARHWHAGRGRLYESVLGNGVSPNGGTPFVAYETAGVYQTEGLQADDSGLHWIDWQTFGIYHAALSAGAPAELVFKWTPTTGSTIPSHFALDACNLYWAEGDQTGGLRIMAIPK